MAVLPWPTVPDGASPLRPAAVGAIDPQRQREFIEEFIEQAAFLSARHVTRLNIAAAHEVVRPRDTRRGSRPLHVEGECR